MSHDLFNTFGWLTCGGYECTPLGVFVYAAAVTGYVLSLSLMFIGFKYAVKGFKENKGGLAGIALMILLAGLALLGYMIGQTISVYTDIEVGQVLYDFFF